MASLPQDSDEKAFEKEGKVLLDIGGGKFDHHNKEPQTTVTNLVIEHLGQRDNPALQRLIKFIERDDFYGKGIISTDQLDRTFGLPGLMGALNKKYKSEPARVIDIILPLFDAYYTEEEKRFVSMPKELEEKLANGKAKSFNTVQRGKKLKCIFIETDEVSMAGFLRSTIGGAYDIVAVKLPSGHVNVLTSHIKKIDLQSLAVLLRIQEAETQGKELNVEPKELSQAGVVGGVPEWHYDKATNSLLNGGPNPQGVKPTSISSFEFPKIIEVGLSEQLWKPEY